MLNLKTWLDKIEDIEPGQTIRFNHTDCEAGEDTRQRLYLTRTHADEATVLGYCHNCQEGGSIKTNQYESYRKTKHAHGRVTSSIREVDDVISEPPGLIEDPALWPTLAISWLYKSKLSNKDCEAFGIKYDPSTDRICLPRWRKVERLGPPVPSWLDGYQLRRLSSNTKAPKYITVLNRDTCGYSVIGKPSTYAVVVEDLVSAIHIRKATMSDPNKGVVPQVYVNYGTKVDPTMMWRLANDYESAVVWLDNDNDHVIEQARLMESTIKMYSSTTMVRRVKGCSDPKHFPPQKIREILDEVWL